MDILDIRLALEVVGGIAMAIGSSKLTVYVNIINAIVSSVEEHSKSTIKPDEVRLKNTIKSEAKRLGVSKQLDTIVKQRGFKKHEQGI